MELFHNLNVYKLYVMNLKGETKRYKKSYGENTEFSFSSSLFASCIYMKTVKCGSLAAP